MTVELDGNGLGPVPVDGQPRQLPAGAGVLVGASPMPTFVAAKRFWPDSVARALAARGEGRALTVCPTLVSPAGSVLALEVARLLVDERGLWDGPGAVITCAVRPPCARDAGVVIVPHPVIVTADGASRSWVVWEITDRLRVPALLAGLSRTRPAVAA
ncbi:hypothetical protein I6A60_02255 [Frankia sp. AgB1.9]|uniref:hypothetical protein n=1 Tax=Frankia sp. AgW1.1 TaxID=1836971 RepID=UPI0019319C6B|nr:hypothetical protein [Frankia sp. AgW1.1]MBL7492553.1 hypothetical protein [Frankia sp. AgW1.1]MBL7546708.1 hypothetical protein [Frankia sp. AgB1.9]MBL7622866.1 hypothetical protein [Frankia sp. AgB1.8]